VCWISCLICDLELAKLFGNPDQGVVTVLTLARIRQFADLSVPPLAWQI
jgi:hypothetical protein